MEVMIVKLNQKGFTLVEVIATVVIITVLTIVVIPSVFSSLNASKEKSYEIMVANIITASKELYEEVYSNELLGVADTSVLYQYNTNGNTNEIITIASNTITTNLQTLVSNGFLSGSNNEDCTESNSNCNTKILIEPKEQKNIGSCIIEIKRNILNNNKVTYEVSSASTSTEDIPCPTDEDYKKGVK